MPKAEVLSTWIELSNGMVLDEPPKRDDFEGILFVNQCEVRRTKNGENVYRSSGIRVFNAPTRDELDEKIAEFANQSDVRLLVDGIDANDSKRLPRRQPLSEGLRDGWAEIYKPKALHEAK